MDSHILIPLPGFELPADFPWRVGFVALVDDQIRKLRCSGHFLPPRFFGYYFQGNTPVGVAGSWTVRLDDVQPISVLPDLVDQMTLGQYAIGSLSRNAVPDFMLVHDRRDGTCNLLDFPHGLNFVEAVDPVDNDSGDEEETKLLGP